MQIRIFTLGVNATEEEQSDLNRFLQSHRVLELKQQYDEKRGLWSFVVCYLSSEISSPSKSERVDYRNILPPEQFALFCSLRDRRKIIAKEENVPAYAIFTDKELAEIARQGEISISSMMKVKGINSGRLEKYGSRMVGNSGQQDVLPEI